MPDAAITTAKKYEEVREIFKAGFNPKTMKKVDRAAIGELTVAMCKKDGSNCNVQLEKVPDYQERKGFTVGYNSQGQAAKKARPKQRKPTKAQEKQALKDLKKVAGADANAEVVIPDK